jgi:hypothetical protein
MIVVVKWGKLNMWTYLHQDAVLFSLAERQTWTGVAGAFVEHQHLFLHHYFCTSDDKSWYPCILSEEHFQKSPY